jgi:RHS repeat-associated protein
MATYNIRPIANAPLFLSDHTLYGSARLGQRQQNKIVNQNYVPPGTHNLVGVTYVQRGWKAYELSNHLGNVLSVISDRKEAGHCNDTLVAFYYPDIIQNNDYYPFGSPMEGRGQQSKTYRFGFNGKEKDQEGMGGGSSTYDYGFRIYNPALGKFLSVDPLTKDYPWYTPYQFAGNKPIWAIDLDGLEEFLRTDYYDINGNLYRTEIVCINTHVLKDRANPQIIVHHSRVTLHSDDKMNVEYMGSTRGTLFGRTNPFISPAIDGTSTADLDRVNYFRRSITFVEDDGTPIMSRPYIRPGAPYPNVIAIDLEVGEQVSPNDQLHYRINGSNPDNPAYELMVYRDGRQLGGLGGKDNDNIITLAQIRGLNDEVGKSPPGYMLWRFDRKNASSASYYSTPVPEQAPEVFINAVPKLVQDRSPQIGTNDAGRGEFQGK